MTVGVERSLSKKTKKMQCQALTYASGVIVGCERRADTGDYCRLHEREKMRSVLGTRKRPSQTFAQDALALALEARVEPEATPADREALQKAREYLNRARSRDLKLIRKLDLGNATQAEIRSLAVRFASEDAADDVASQELTRARKKLVELQEEVLNSVATAIRLVRLPHLGVAASRSPGS